MTIDVFERYAALDPAKSPGIQPEWSTMAPVPLSTQDGRELHMQTQQQTPKQPGPLKRRKTGFLIAAIAVVLLLIVGGVGLLASGSESDQPPAGVPTTSTTAPAGSDALAPVTDADALAAGNAFYLAYNAGDVEGLMTLFAPGVRLYDSYSGNGDLDEWEMDFTWNAAAGTQLSSKGCTVGDGDDATAARVVCIGANQNAIAQATGAQPVPLTVTIDVTSDGISFLSYLYGDPDHNETQKPFMAWMNANNPADAERADYGNWTTIEEAKEFGELSALYATEWATYLSDNNCTYQDDC